MSTDLFDRAPLKPLISEEKLHALPFVLVLHEALPEELFRVFGAARELVHVGLIVVDGVVNLIFCTAGERILPAA